VKPEFHEEFQSPCLDPVDGRREEFDWAGLSELLGESRPIAESAPDFALLGETLNRIFAYLLNGRAASRHLDRTIGRRVIAMIWVVRPDLIEGTPSLARIARQLGETRAGLSKQACEFSRLFGVVSRGQSRGWNRKPPPPRMNGEAHRANEVSSKVRANGEAVRKPNDRPKPRV
jgi:hypothetical protein